MDEGGEDLSVDDPFGEIEASEIEIGETETGAAGGDVLENLEDKDSEELQRLREAGAQPMTPAPEDTSYLEEDPLAFSDLEEGSLDLSNAVIDEPDLSGEIKDNPLEEPSLDDISIDLDLDEEISLDEDEHENEHQNEDGEAGFDLTEETGSIVEEIELPAFDEKPEIEEEEFEDPSAGSADLAVIPEGFVVEAEDPGVSAIDEGEEAFPEETGDSGMTGDDLLEEVKEEALPAQENNSEAIPSHLKQELKTVLSYMDQLLESLPDEKIEEFAKSEYFDTYKKLFKELGLV
jgi:hypothetical protein